MSDDFLWFEGIAFPNMGFRSETLRKVHDEFVIKDEDVIILTYPKSDTEVFPWEAAHSSINACVQGDCSGAMLSSVIYLMRNPRDVFVSGYFFWNSVKFVKKPKSWEQYFEWFCQGNVIYGSWFDHIHGWMPMREKKNFLLLSYEELKQDTRRTVEKICQFLGKTLEPEELNLILKNSSFQSMKENKMSNFSLLSVDFVEEKAQLLRKGISGDWKNHLTVAQAEAFDKLFQEKMTDLPRELFPWE
ncbi:bile salt sulfotransferase [Theropithecus gelada]|uniref:bile salt sulfotransferase n=1 Tax=Theropithecus gelada TaxID=9565 RepID=UPI000DC1AE85|nr:bile salt sulfotransferase [Theropithecus gelada]